MRTRYIIILLMFCMLLLTASCSVKSIFHLGTDIEYHEDRLVYASTAEGSPLFVFLEFPRGLDEDALFFKKVHREYEAWVFHQNVWKCFYVQEKREGKDPKKIVNPSKTAIAVWTEKDQLVFGIGADEQGTLVLTDPIYADRSRKVAGAAIEYTLVPAKLYFGKRMIAGSAYYQHIAFSGKVKYPSSSASIEFLNNGSFCYLWDRTGDFWYIESLRSERGNSTFAAAQDRRGEWEETYQAEVVSSETKSVPQDSEVSWTVSVPAWHMEAQLSTVQFETASKEATIPPPDEKGQSGSINSLLERFPNHHPLSRDRFYEVEGTLRIGDEKRAVYGILQSCCAKKR